MILMSNMVLWIPTIYTKVKKKRLFEPNSYNWVLFYKERDTMNKVVIIHYYS